MSLRRFSRFACDAQSMAGLLVSKIPASESSTTRCDSSSRPSSLRRFIRMDRFPALRPAQYKLRPSEPRGQRCPSIGPAIGSTLMTSAPADASVEPARGAATNAETSTTRIRRQSGRTTERLYSRAGVRSFGRICFRPTCQYDAMTIPSARRSTPRQTMATSAFRSSDRARVTSLWFRTG